MITIGDALMTNVISYMPGERPVTETGALVLQEMRGLDRKGHEHVVRVIKETDELGQEHIVQREWSSCPRCGAMRSDVVVFGEGCFGTWVEMNRSNPKACMHEYHGLYRPGAPKSKLTVDGLPK
jgi:hypothetical protein